MKSSNNQNNNDIVKTIYVDTTCETAECILIEVLVRMINPYAITQYDDASKILPYSCVIDSRRVEYYSVDVDHSFKPLKYKYKEYFNKLMRSFFKYNIQECMNRLASKRAFENMIYFINTLMSTPMYLSSELSVYSKHNILYNLISTYISGVVQMIANNSMMKFTMDDAYGYDLNT